ncbi:sensor histidine kinase [Moheibacter sediminis]|nr:histidine kinase [Moheibacter sediminis]
MKKQQEISVHLGFWVLFFGMNILFEKLNSDKSLPLLWSTLQEIGFSLLQMIVFYINYLWICPKTIPQKKWFLLILGQVFLLFLFPGLRHIIEEIIIYQITGNHNYPIQSQLTPYYVYDNSYYSVRIILFSFVFYFLKIIWDNAQRINELQLENKHAELQNLKNQLSPHFLFNTLNSFYSDLMDTQPKIAEDVLKLSDMLRYVTYENEKDEVSLESEIQFIQNYIDLFSRRFDNQIAVEFQYENHNNFVTIPSLLLIHFVENALKHGISNDNFKPIRIDLKTKENRLLFRVENSYKLSENYDESGIGYKNVRQRLELLFQKNYTLEVQDANDFYKIELNIPLSQ